MGFFLDMLGLLVCFQPLVRTLWFVIEDYRLVVYREVGSIPEELLLGQGQVFYLVFFVVWLITSCSISSFIASKN
jgi:hypothetical protein